MDILLFTIAGIVLFVVVRSFSDYEKENNLPQQEQETPPKNNTQEKILPKKKPILENDDEVTNAQIETGLVISLMAKLSKADGKICMLEEELLVFCFQDFSKPFKNPLQIENILKQIFEDEKNNESNDISDIAQQFYSINKHSYTKRVKVLQHLVNLAYIDKVLSKSEEAMLKQISDIFKISKDDYISTIKSFHKFYSDKKEDMDIKEAYYVLQVDENATLAQIKSKYRQLVKKYHPDLLFSKGFEDDYVSDCTRRLQQINTAYELIKKQRK